MYNPTDSSCKTSVTVKLGEKQDRHTKTEERVVSGWMVDRVLKFAKAMDATCKSQSDEWKLPD